MSNCFHKTAKISGLASIDVSQRNTHTYIGKNSVIDDFVKIKHVGGNKNIKIGDNVYINSGTVIYSGNGVTIKNNVLISPNCSIVPVNHGFKSKNKLIRKQKFLKSRGGILIEEDVWIGANSVILDGSIIRKGAVIGANSLVRSEIEAYSINVGNPSRVIGYRK